MKIQLIAAKAKNDVIGNANQIPWQAKGELKIFKTITMGGTLVMGRKTFESIGRPLPGRNTIIVSRQSDLSVDNCQVAKDLDTALELARQIAAPIFIAGGGEIYRQALPYCGILHLTTIDIEPRGDVLFPTVSFDEFELIDEQHYSTNLNYTYRKYCRSN